MSREYLPLAALRTNGRLNFGFSLVRTLIVSSSPRNDGAVSSPPLFGFRWIGAGGWQRRRCVCGGGEGGGIELKWWCGFFWLSCNLSNIALSPVTSSAPCRHGFTQSSLALHVAIDDFAEICTFCQETCREAWPCGVNEVQPCFKFSHLNASVAEKAYPCTVGLQLDFQAKHQLQCLQL